MFKHSLLACALLGSLAVGCQRPSTTEPGEHRARAAENVRATDIDLGRSLDSDLTIADKTRTFRPTDTVYASVDTKGSSPGTAVSATFRYEDGRIVRQDQAVIAPSGKEHTEFHISQPGGLPTGKYDVEIHVGNDVKTQSFEVK